jgi:Family of unknown function (DUF695)
MFGIFKKTARYPTESKWSVLNAEHDGKPLVVRRNESAKQLRGSSEYNHRVGIAVPLRAPDERGLPGAEEVSQLNGIEDLLCERLEANQDSLQVLAITTGGMREFVFYTRAAHSLQPVLERFQQDVSSHAVQCYIEPDAKWSVYEEFA